MKRTDYKTYLRHALVMVAFTSAVAACVEEDVFSDNFKKTSVEGLSVMTSVSEPTLVTRTTTESDEALNEKHLQMLDVFVEAVADPGKFISQYHLVATTTEPIREQFDNWLADNWRAEGLEIGKYYNIYVATNNTQTSVTKDLTTFDVDSLKALVADEVTDSIAVVDSATNNISWPWTDQFANTPSGFIYKQYVKEADAAEVTVNGSLYGFTTEKEFMMDGVLENWTPDATTRDQVFKPVILNRAAAKIVLNVKFDADFLKSLTHKMEIEGTDTTWTEKPADEQVTITGKPAWRFYNFAFGAPVFTPETQGAGVEVHNSATMLFHPYAYAGDDKHFSITTYTYPNKWAEADYATAAPSLVVSIGFTENGVTNYHYYRVPLVKSTVTAIERNHIYVINATIATRGSELHEDITDIEDIQYAVLPWNDETNSAAIHNEVTSVQHYYFNVNPKVYTLRGDGPQSVILNYSKATGTKVGWKLFEITDDDGLGTKGNAVASTESSAVWGWYYNSNGDLQTTYNDGTNWNHLKVDIAQSEEGTTGSNGTITVSSTALTNKAIKYILLRVYLDEEETFDDNGNPTLYEDILIRHFPTDNIQSFTGSWSSYHDADGATKTVTKTLYDIDEVLQLVNQFGATYTVNENAVITDYLSYANYQAHNGEEGYNRTETTVNRNIWTNAVPQDARANANSEANAYPYGNYYYWGTGEETGNQNSWDYIRNYRYRRYTTLHQVQYTHTYQTTSYTVTYQTASAGDWVDWETDAGQNVDREYENDHFNAKVFKYFDAGYFDYYGDRYRWAADEYAVPIYRNNNIITYRNPISADGTYTNLTNNHMYVIQISSTSDKYVIGKPYIVNNVSQDDVVSPAFMIASQLGAVSSYSSADYAADAATHCGRYMEVGTDGKRYVGWRLPTADELAVIGEYQQGVINNYELPDEYRVISEVLGGPRYFSLDGSYVRTEGIDDEPIYNYDYWGNPIGDPIGYRHYLRCVRDLSAAEIEELNGFAAIQQHYQSK